MAQWILGLDLGSYSVKGALFQATVRSFQLTDLFQSAPLDADHLSDEDRMTVVREAVLRLIQENNVGSNTTVVTALPGSQVSSRVLKLPLPEKQAEKVIAFELETHIPFDLEEIVIDHHTMIAEKASTIVLAAAVAKEAVAHHLALLSPLKIDPAYITLDSLALYNTLQLHKVTDLPETFAIIDLGHQKTSVCIIRKGQVAFVRTLFTAGRAITESIRTDLDLTLDQAIKVKHEHGILELESKPFKSADLRKLSAAIAKPVDPLLREITQTFHAYRAQTSSLFGEIDSVQQIFLCGGTSLIRNLTSYVQTLTGVPTSLYSVFSEQNDISNRLGEREPILAQAVGLGLRAAARGPNMKALGRINFRKGEFSFARDLSGVRNQVLFFGKWVASLFIVVLFLLIFRHANLSKQYDHLEEAIVKSVNSSIPDLPQKPKSSAEALRILQSKLSQNRTKLEVLTSGLNDVTALTILKEISKRIPENIPLDSQELSIERNRVTLRAQAENIAQVEDVISSLQGYEKFIEIKRGDIREGPGGKKQFNLTATVGNRDEPQEIKKP